MNANPKQLSVTFAVCMLVVLGCRISRKVPDVDTRAVAVAHEMSSPTETESITRPPDSKAPAAETKASKLATGFEYCKSAVAGTVKAAGAIVLGGVIWAVGSMIDSDEADTPSTPRKQADQDLNLWMDDRGRWERED